MLSGKERTDYVAQIIDDCKGDEITILYTGDVSSSFEYMVIASGHSTRHVSAIAQRIKENLKIKGCAPCCIEGLQSSDWVLLDYGDLIVHVMHPAIRAYYNIEGIWDSSRVDQSREFESHFS